MKKIFYLDTETTGVNPISNDIVQIAFIIEIDGKIKGKYNLFCQPLDYSRVSEEALRKQNRTLEDIKKYPSMNEAYEKLISIMSSYVDKYDKMDKFYPAGYNVKFDINFLSNFFTKNGDKYYGAWFNWKMIDPYPLLHLLDSMGAIALPDYKLGTVCKHYDIQLTAHDALNDIEATVKLIELLKERYINVDEKK